MRLEPRRSLQKVVLGVPILAFVAAGFTHRWIADDGFIYLRVVREITAGHGPVFNAGQRVEAYTSPLWLFMLWISDVLTPIPLEWIAVTLGLVCSLAGLAFAVAAASELSRRPAAAARSTQSSGARDAPGAFVMPFGILVFVAVLPAWVFETSGLETGLCFAWIGACLAILVRWASCDRRRVRPYEAVILGLGWLVRPELVLLSALFVAVTVFAQWDQDRARDRVQHVATMVALPLAYEVFRMGYYGSLVANTAIAKEGGEVRWHRGWIYFLDFARPYWLWLPAALLVAFGYVPLLASFWRGSRRASLVVGTFLVGAVVEALYVVAVGGDYMHARLLLPALFTFCAPVAVISMTRRRLVAVAVVPWALAATLMLRPPSLGDAPRVGAATLSTEFWGKVSAAQYGWGPHGPDRHWYRGPYVYAQERPIRRRYARLDVAVASSVPLPTAVLRSVGLASFAMGPRLNVLDVYGLGDPLAAHLSSPPRGDGHARLPGHEKPLPAPWIAARLTPAGAATPASDFPDVASPLIAPATGAKFEQQVAYARAALRCPAIEELQEASGAKLTFGRFVGNVVRAFRNTRMRIPPDPQDAYAEYCHRPDRRASAR
jgi:arabinofuranosyltransferase